MNFVENGVVQDWFMVAYRAVTIIISVICLRVFGVPNALAPFLLITVRIGRIHS